VSYNESRELRYLGDDAINFSFKYQDKINELRVYGYEKGYSLISYDMTEDIMNDTNTFPQYYGNLVLINKEKNTIIINYSAIIILEGLFLDKINIGSISYGGSN
jgi:hypothetical protein